MTQSLEWPDSVVDIHCHVASTDYFPPSFFDGVLENMLGSLRSKGVFLTKKKVGDLYFAKFQDPLCDQLIREMDEAGIERSVLLLPDFTYALRDGALTISEMIDRHGDILRRHPGRLLAFAGVDPRWGSDGIDLFEKAIKCYDFHGLKVYPPCGFSPSDRSLYPYYEICAQHSIPALVHIGATSPTLQFEPARPLLLDQAARDFPSVDFILAHGSVHHPDECAMLCSHRPNVYLDVSGFEVDEMESLRRLFSRGIHHKVLFGTDWPLFRLQGTQRDYLQRLVEHPQIFAPAMKRREIEAFFSGNANRVLEKRLLGDRQTANATN